MRIVFTCFLILLFTFGALAQMDTVYLKEVEIVVPHLLKYTHGGSISTLEKATAASNLNELISTNNSIYFKNYGNGQLSTITMRGTTASHTSVIWNGIPVNSPTLGQTDFSLWPSYLMEQATLYLGSSSPAFGSGAMGGTVVLSQKDAIYEPNFVTNVKLEAGSFNNYTTAATILNSNEKFITQTKVFRNSIDNNFEILSQDRDQNNAAVMRYGFDQQFRYKINKHQFINFNGQYVHNHREIQPLKFDQISSDELLNENLRLSLNYLNEGRLGIWNTTIGYVIDDQRFNLNSKVKSTRTTLDNSFEFPISSSTVLKTGITYANFKSDVDNYSTQVNEHRLDLFTALNYNIKDWWRISLNLRKGFYTDKSFPFVPSFGQEIDLNKNSFNHLRLKSLISKSYRIPTLNDRFWGNQGNPDLLSESGNHVEVGIIWHNKKNHFNVTLNHYRSWIDDLIVWLPTSGIFKPQNNRKVNISGIESSIEWSTTLLGGKLNTKVNYNYTKSTNKKGLISGDDTGLNKQLPYTPFHTGNLSLKYRKNAWEIKSFLEYTDKRFTTLDNSKFNTVDAYKLINISLTKSLIWNSLEVKPYLRVNNLLNSDYENFKNYAMPSRNLLLGIDFNFNKKQKITITQF